MDISQLVSYATRSAYYAQKIVLPRGLNVGDIQPACRSVYGI